MSQYPNNPTNPTSQPPAGSGQLVMVGVVLAIIAVIMMNVYVEMRVAAQDEETITFFKFTDALDAGDRIDAKDIIAFDIPVSLKSAFGTDAVRESTSKPGTPSDGIGFDLNISVVKGEVLKSSQFLASGRRAGRNDPSLGEHQIALSVDSDDQPADLAPGDRVDLYGSIPRSRSNQYMVVMEYVEVAAVGERRSEAGDGNRSSKYGSITINIDPKQVPLLFDIQQRLPDKEFRISLRASNDASTPITKGEALINPEVLRSLGLD